MIRMIKVIIGIFMIGSIVEGCSNATTVESTSKNQENILVEDIITEDIEVEDIQFEEITVTPITVHEIEFSSDVNPKHELDFSNLRK